MKRLAILGASGHGKVVADAAAQSGSWGEIVFFDDAYQHKQLNGPWSVVGDTELLLDKMGAFDGVIVAIGTNSTRVAKCRLLIDRKAPLVNVIHPAATVSPYVSLGAGSVVCAGAVINIDTRLGVGCIVNTGATIDHDCVLGAGVHVSPGAHLAGGVTVGDLSWVGIGACVRQLVTIGANVTVGAGAAVVNAIADNATVVGVPAQERA